MKRKSKAKTKSITTDSDYWKKVLANGSASPKIWLEGFDIVQPLDKGKAPQYFNYYNFTLPQTLLQKLTLFAEKNEVSLRHILLCGFLILLNRMATSANMALGMSNVTSAGKKLEMSPPFLVAKSVIMDTETLSEFIKKQLSELRTQELALEVLPQALLDEHIDTFNYLFTTYHENQPEHTHTLQPSRHSLVCICDLNHIEQLRLAYNPTLFNKRSLDIIEKHFMIVLEKIATSAHELVTEFSILTEEEKTNLLNKWNAPRANFNEKVCTHKLIEAMSRKFPNNLALCHEDIQINYADLENYSNQLARFLIQEGVEPGDNVAVLMERTPYSIVALLSILKTGATYIPINPRYADDRIFYILNDCKAKIILTNQMERIPLDIQYKGVFFENAAPLKVFSSKKLNIPVSPQQNAYIVYTSGTTGKPKGVVIKHINLINLIACYQRLFNLTPEDRASQFSSQGFDTFFCEILPFLSFGASVHIIDDNTKLIPGLFIPWLKKHEITICDLPTAYAQILFSEVWPKSLSLRILKLGGDRLTRLPTKKVRFDIWNTYGTTETTIECVLGKVYEAGSKPASKVLNNTPPIIGKPIANSEVYVVDAFKQPVPIGVAGELLVGGICVASGFFRHPELTQEQFIENSFRETSGHLFKTGDLVRWLPNGEIEFVGKKRHQIEIKGYQVGLNEIETTLSQFPDVSEVIVTTKEVMGRPKTLIAYLVPNIEKIRIPYHEACLAEIANNKFMELITTDISREGLAVSGVIEPIPINSLIRVNFKLPGIPEPRWFNAKVMWQSNQHAGIRFETTLEERRLINNSIKHFLLNHNLMDVLYNVSAKRNLRNALRQRLPEHMIPSVVNVLPNLPLTFNGKIDWKSLPPPQNYEKFLEKQTINAITPTEKKLAALWMDILSLSNISMSDSFFDLGGTSFTLTQCVLKIEKMFNIILPLHVAVDLPYIPIIAAYIDTQGRQYPHQSPVQHEIRHDLILPEDIAPIKKMPKVIQTILVTGATSFLGIFVIREILKQTDIKVYCLMKPSASKTPVDLFSEAVAKYGLSNEISLGDRRVAIMASNVGSHNMGLTTEHYQHLCETIDLIYHCEADSNLTLPYSSLRQHNVASTLEVIRFATARKTKFIHYISSFAAATNIDTMGNYLEEFPKHSEAPQLIGGYAISQWVSERLLGEIKNRGLVVSLFRTGHINGSSENGVTHTNDAFLYLIKGCIQLGFAPNWQEKVSILPVNFVSKVLVALSLHYPDKSHVFHIEDPQGMMWADLIAWLNEYGYNIKIIDATEWRQKLLALTSMNALYPLLALYLLPKKPLVDAHMQNALRILEQLNISYPRVDNVLLERYFDYLCRIGFLPDPKEPHAPATKKSEVRRS